MIGTVVIAMTKKKRLRSSSLFKRLIKENIKKIPNNIFKT
jgi:hypothetical protein